MLGGFAFSQDIYIANESNLPKDKETLINAFRSRLPSSLPGRKIKYITPSAAADLSGDDNIIVALGKEALSVIIKGSGTSPVVAAFISRSSYDDVVAGKRHTIHPISAVYSDPSPKRQIALIKTLLGENASVGILFTPSLSRYIEEAKYAAKEMGVKVTIIDITDRRDAKNIFKSLGGTKTVLLQKDKEIFETIPLDTLLSVAYDINNLGIIGYSSGVVKNGALATTYTSLDDTARSIASIITKIERGNSVPPPGFSELYSISINKYVARSLGLQEKNADEVKKALSTLLKEGK